MRQALRFEERESLWNDAIGATQRVAPEARCLGKIAVNVDLKPPVFRCQQCGDCCAGRGGIMVKPEEVEEMAAFLGLAGVEFRRRFVEDSPLGPRLTVADGVCVFLREGKNCRVHPVKPLICRQWPFLPAILADADELEYAKTACPGISPACSHEEFVDAARRRSSSE